MSRYFLAVVSGLVIFSASTAHAAPCRDYVVGLGETTYRPGYYFKCFKTRKAAKRAGYERYIRQPLTWVAGIWTGTVTPNGGCGESADRAVSFNVGTNLTGTATMAIGTLGSESWTSDYGTGGNTATMSRLTTQQCGGVTATVTDTMTLTYVDDSTATFKFDRQGHCNSDAAVCPVTWSGTLTK